MSVTYVSACVDIGREFIHSTLQRSFEGYIRTTGANLETRLPLYLFTNAGFDIPSHRNSSNTVIEHFDRATLMQRAYRKNLYKEAYARADAVKSGPCSELDAYAPLVVGKLQMIKRVMQLNPFNTEYFAWIDTPFTYGLDGSLDSEERCADFSRRVAALAGSENKWLHLAHQSPRLDLFWSSRINKWMPQGVCPSMQTFGFFWVVSRQTFAHPYRYMMSQYRDLLNDGVIATEELLCDIARANHPEWFTSLELELPGYKQHLSKILRELS